MRGRVTVLFSPEDGDLAALRWWANAKGYPKREDRRGKQQRTVFAHRLVFERVLGRKPLPSEICDHINGDKLDCRRANLRCVDPKGSAQNKHVVRSASGYRGVSFHRQSGKWVAHVGHAGRTHYAGLHDTPEAAAVAAEAKRKELGFLGSATS